jgi:outer membrane protein insertion porin family
VAGVLALNEGGHRPEATRPPARGGRQLLVWAVVILAAGGLGVFESRAGERPPSTNYASIKVTGCGYLQNLQLVRTIRLARADKGKLEFFDAAFIEDAALTIQSKIVSDGYLSPRIVASVWDTNGVSTEIVWEGDFNTTVPAVQARKVRFRVERGRLSYYRSLTIEGLDALRPWEARSYFFPTGFLFQSKRWRPYTPARFEQSIAGLRAALARLGFESATIEIIHRDQDERTGGVRVHLRIQEGLPSQVQSVQIEAAPAPGMPAGFRSVVRPAVPYSRVWANEFRFRLRTNEYTRGFPDATVDLFTQKRTTNQANVQLDLLARVITGPAIGLGQIRYEGRFETAQSVLDSRIRLEPGGQLDRLKVDEGRNRLSRLGIFNRVDVQYEPVDERTRNVIYQLEDAKTLDFNLLLSWGSYELLRGGFELEERNVFERAHAVRLRGIQSFKATSGDLRYTIPEIWRRDVDLYFQASALLREEVSFDREEFGGGVGIDRYFRALRTRASLRYDHQFLIALDAPRDTGQTNGIQRTRAASFILDLTSDRRDNPLSPHKGLKWNTTMEYASDYFGGEVDYQRWILGGSYHLGLGGGRYLHLGAMHGLTFTLGGTSDELPFNKRFFPGGESSVRGFQQGEAAPRNADGKVIGAETVMEGSLEFEQFLTPNWSVVGFIDGVAFTADRGDYPSEEELYSAGGGIRWRTLIGPVRLEYGRNLNPRRGDPAGTFHFAIGIPF